MKIPPKHLRAMRHFLKLTQADVAAAIDIHPRTISRIENGQRPLFPDEADRFIQKFGIPDWLLQLCHECLGDEHDDEY